VSYRMCADCGKKGQKLQSCSQCRFAHYCGPTCQRNNLVTHKLECSDMGEKYKMFKQFIALSTTRSFKSMTDLTVWSPQGAFIQVNDIARFIEECSENPYDANFYNIAITKDIIESVIPRDNDPLDAILAQMEAHNTQGLDIVYHPDYSRPLTIHVPGIRAYFIRV
jgi:hypothetical protein